VRKDENVTTEPYFVIQNTMINDDPLQRGTGIVSVVWVGYRDFYVLHVTSLSVYKTVNFKRLHFNIKLMVLANFQVFGRKYILQETPNVPSSDEIVGRPYTTTRQ
jgi:hypothetical protein